ncbi:MAG TPA: hypothetical protein PKE31_12785 [Pseudomonadota bacterium]|nr:hypothetical protein [Pseudomonadota bacterium]
MKKLLWLVFAMVFVYFALTVKVGSHTLWGHVVRIARTPEAKDLADGAKETFKDAARKAQHELDTARPDAPTPPATLSPKQPTTPPPDPMTR